MPISNREEQRRGVYLKRFDKTVEIGRERLFSAIASYIRPQRDAQVRRPIGEIAPVRRVIFTYALPKNESTKQFMERKKEKYQRSIGIDGKPRAFSFEETGNEYNIREDGILMTTMAFGPFKDILDRKEAVSRDYNVPPQNVIIFPAGCPASLFEDWGEMIRNEAKFKNLSKDWEDIEWCLGQGVFYLTKMFELASKRGIDLNKMLEICQVSDYHLRKATESLRKLDMSDAGVISKTYVLRLNEEISDYLEWLDMARLDIKRTYGLKEEKIDKKAIELGPSAESVVSKE